MKQNKTYKIVIGALFAALIFVVATVVKIPTPTGGVIQLADSIIVVSGILLGPVIGGIASGIGAGLFDLLNGYGQYAPATFIIKLAMASTAYFTYRIIPHKGEKPIALSIKFIICSLVSGVIMVTGYFGFERIMLGDANAVAGIIPNFIQAAGSVVIGIPIFLAVHKAYSIVSPKLSETK